MYMLQYTLQTAMISTRQNFSLPENVVSASRIPIKCNDYSHTHTHIRSDTIYFSSVVDNDFSVL